MIVGNTVACNGCQREYRIRYNMGGNFPQSASFYCDGCGLTITYGFDEKRKLISENVTILNDNLAAQVINLHPELPIDESKKFDAKYFPSLEYLGRIKDDELTELRKAQISNIEYIKLWDKLSEDFRRLSEGRLELLRQKYGDDDKKMQTDILSEAVHIAGLFLEGRWFTLLQKALAELDKVKSYKGFPQLQIYLQGNKDHFLLHRMYELMSLYRSVEAELLSTLLSQKQGRSLNGLSSSAKWDKIERIYGDLYEIYGELAIIPTVINNLLMRSSHEQFATAGFTLAAYMESDKAGRMKNFINNLEFKPLIEFYEPWLRNGTHHKTAQINKAKQKIVVKIGKGGKSDKVLSFVQYIEYCNELYARCLILLVLFQKIVE